MKALDERNMATKFLTIFEKQKYLQQLYEASSEEVFLYDPCFYDPYSKDGKHARTLMQNVRVIERTTENVGIIVKYKSNNKLRYLLQHVSIYKVVNDEKQLSMSKAKSMLLFNDEMHFEAMFQTFHVKKR